MTDEQLRGRGAAGASFWVAFDARPCARIFERHEGR
jgi:hypothetical protein